eukprot:Pgem_evm1s18966
MFYLLLGVTTLFSVILVPSAKNVPENIPENAMEDIVNLIPKPQACIITRTPLDWLTNENNLLQDAKAEVEVSAVKTESLMSTTGKFTFTYKLSGDLVQDVTTAYAITNITTKYNNNGEASTNICSYEKDNECNWVASSNFELVHSQEFEVDLTK